MLPPVLAIMVIAGLGILVFFLTGFSYSFLWDPTSWDIGFSFLPFTPQDPYWWAFLVGAANTLISGVTAIILATMLGFGLSLARSSSNPILRGIVRFYADAIRNIPVILQAMFWYGIFLGMPVAKNAIEFAGIHISNRGFFFPWFSDPGIILGFVLALLVALVGALTIWGRLRRGGFEINLATGALLLVIACAAAAMILNAGGLAAASTMEWPQLQGLNIRGGLRIPIEFAALVTALTIYRAAYISEVFRAGFRSVSQGHLDAAHALSLSAWTTLTKIRLPLALITILPPLTSEFIVIIKITSIGLLVGFNDLYAISVNATTVTGKTLQIMALLTTAYLIINFTLATVMNILNQRVAFRGRRRA